VQIKSHTLTFSTQGHTQIVDLTPRVQELLNSSSLREGQITVFAVGSTAGITTVEYEPGLVETDLPALFDKLAPYGKPYAHDETWGDDNGAAHLRASLLGSSLTVPFLDGGLLLGTWQQIIFLDFDTRPRSRKVVVQIIGE
jgi:secondary thiamine-phosphate synthase enzyme